MPNYTSVDKKYTEKVAKLVEVTCMHTMVLAEMHSLKKKENKMLDVHALRGERYMCVHGKKDYTSMFDQGVHQSGYFFWLLHPKHVQVIYVQKICFLEINHGIISCYYFSRLRPPELEVQVSRFKWWRLFSLCDQGWGPPDRQFTYGTEMAHNMSRLLVLEIKENCRDVKGYYVYILGESKF